jgi:AcrR family transcriptional regulator
MTQGSFYFHSERRSLGVSPKLSDALKEQRKIQILEAAERVFMRKGYEPATIKDIVEEADMSRGWIYLYYKTKEEIFEDLMEKIDQDQAKQIQSNMERAGTIWETIQAELDQKKKELADSENNILATYYEYFISGWRDERRRNSLVRRFDNGISGFAQLLQAGVDSGEFQPDLPVELIAKIVASTLDGITMHVLAVGWERADAIRQLDELTKYVKQLLRVTEKK